jgi:hypothetical protein
MIRWFLILILIQLSLHAKESSHNLENSFEQSIDFAHQHISSFIKGVGTYADKKLDTWLRDANESETFFNEDSSAKTYELEKRVDYFFLEKKYLESTNRSYIRMGIGESISSTGESKLNYAFSAKIDLGESKKRLHLFMDDLRRDEQNRDLETQSAVLSESTDQATVGLSYFYPQKYGLHMKSAIAIHGLNPFARVRLEYPIYMGRWSFLAAQKVIYSLKHKFEEQSDLYLDNRVGSYSLVRLFASRSTTQDSNGMYYSSGIQYFYNPQHNRGLSLSLYANGNTKYGDYELNTRTNLSTYTNKNQFYSYILAPSWRENIYKDWLFFQITPSVVWHEERDYDRSYNLAFSFDLYFGNRR